MTIVSAMAALRKNPLIFQRSRLPFAAAAVTIWLLAFWWIAPPAAAQTVSVGSVSGQAGTGVDLKVNFTAGTAGIATLQFDLAYPSSLSLVSTTTGVAAATAGKSANGSAISGGVRVLLFGLNQNLIGSGEVAVIRLNIAAGTPPGNIAVTVANIVASNALGLNVTTAGTNGSVTVAGQGDTTPPLISAVVASGITQSSARITWTTDEPADSQVEHGTTTAYGTSTLLNSNLVVSHSSTLTGLSAGTTYHYRVRSKDAAGNLATSGDFTLTTQAETDTTAPTIFSVSASSITTTGATVVWSTNEASDSQVEYGGTVAYGSSTVLNIGMVTSHSQMLSGLQANTTYHYRVKSRDAAGNLAVSPDFTFATQDATDTVPPVIEAVTATNITCSSAVIRWTTNEAADSQVEYGGTVAYGSSTVLNVGMVTSHSQVLSGLQANTAYHYRVKSRDAAGNLAVSPDFTFATQDATDTVPPVIEAVTATNITCSSAVIRWTTNEAADSQVEYGVTSSYGSSTIRDLTLVDSHAVALSGLTADTLYYCRALSRDAAGNVAVSSYVAFTTRADDDATPPVISDIASSNVTSNSARISWTTNEPADTQVEYGTTIFYGAATSLNPSLTDSHAQTLTGLTAKVTYHYRVKSRDGSGNLAVSEDHIFTTADTPGDITPATTLFYPRLLAAPTTEPGSPNEEFIGFGITNLDSTPAKLGFTAYNTAGTEAAGPGITNPVVRDLLPGEQVALVDKQIFGSGFSGPDSIGWVKIESTVGRAVGFFMMFNAVLTELDGATFTSNPISSFIYPELEAQGFTRVSIANPNPDPAALTLDLVGSNGITRSSATRNIPANGSLAADLTDIFPGASFAGDSYVRASSNRGVLPFELIGKPTQYVASLNGQDASQEASTLYCPQYVIGEAWQTAISVVNLDNKPGTVTFRFIHDDASQTGATKIVPIDPYGKIYVDDPAFFQSFIVAPGGALRQGYVEIIGNDVRLAGSVVLGDPDRTAFASALPLVSVLDRSFIFSHLASNEQYFTGVALLNPGLFDAAVDVEIYKADGTLDRTTKVLVPRLRRISRMLTDLFPELEGQERLSGYIKLTSTQPLATFALFGTRNLSALSAIPPQTVK